MLVIKSYGLSVLLMISAGFVYGQEIKIVGSIDHEIRVPLKSHGLMMRAQHPKYVSLLKLQMSNDVRNKFIQKLHTAEPYLTQSTSEFSRSMQLGMNNVPVLDQGAHGSCVTFAVTAAVDASLGRGDYISQLCQLNLGKYLENNSYASSGWNGAWGVGILGQMTMFGIVNKDHQRMGDCGQLTEYPLHGGNPDNELSITQFAQLSEPVFENSASWTSLLSSDQVLYDSVDTAKVLIEIKKALHAGDRVNIGTILIALDQGVVGAIGSYHSPYDTWVMTPKLAASMDESQEQGGHEMIITGYDDDAIARDDEGGLHRGLFTLRNSWGSVVGDHGDFYIAYDYLQPLILEASRIRTLRD